MRNMEPFERLLSLHTPEHWVLDQLAWQATSPANSFTDLSSQSSQSLCCNPADLLLQGSSAPPPACHSTPEPEGPGIHRTASTRIRTARRPNVTKGPPDMVPPERPVVSLEGRTTAIGRTARKHKLYLSVSTSSRRISLTKAPKHELTPHSFSSHSTWTDLMSADTVGPVLTDPETANGTSVPMKRTRSSGVTTHSARRPRNIGFFIAQVHLRHL